MTEQLNFLETGDSITIFPLSPGPKRRLRISMSVDYLSDPYISHFLLPDFNQPGATMMSSLCSHTLSCSPSPNYWHWVLKPPRMPISLHRSLRVTASPPTSLNHRFGFRQKGETRNGDLNALEMEIPRIRMLLSPSLFEEKLQEEFAEPEFDHSTVLRNDTVSSLQKGTHALFSSGSWTVPWTGKTILQDFELKFVRKLGKKKKKSKVRFCGVTGYAPLDCLILVSLGLRSVAIVSQCFIPFHLIGSVLALMESGSLIRFGLPYVSIGQPALTEDATTCVPWGGHGFCLCTIKKPVGINALA
ncbi:hypothetical protein Pint_17580 [Pistacia integerrima]|uniref:Uncharacterized protein n=1 Tax=Pistacia integerrima TaxID=434235 RepID=A0ACC0YZU3_9ROSI|nr:hypothetical protein Pint_17580 [Pistacia integerrima]